MELNHAVAIASSAPRTTPTHDTQNTYLAHRSLTTTATHARAVDAEPLLRLVPQTTRLVRSRRARHAADGWQLAVLPHADTLEETKNIGLFLLPQLFDVFVSLW